MFVGSPRGFNPVPRGNSLHPPVNRLFLPFVVLPLPWSFAQKDGAYPSTHLSLPLRLRKQAAYITGTTTQIDGGLVRSLL